METSSVPSSVPSMAYEEHGFDRWADQISRAFGDNIPSGARLFRTSSRNLFNVYLEAIPKEFRQHYHCFACHTFLRRFGDLVWVGAEGSLHSVFWDESLDTPEFFRPVVHVLANAVENRAISRPFLPTDEILGTPFSGPIAQPTWRHFHAVVTLLQSFPENTAKEQTDAIMRAFGHVRHALSEVKVETLQSALLQLQSGTVSRPEKMIAGVKWLLNLKQIGQHIPQSQMRNLLWDRVAQAPEGFRHPRTSVYWEFLQHIQVGRPIADAVKSVNMKLTPDQHRRPTAQPAAQVIDAADKMVEKMGLGPSFRRRYACFEEIPAFWKPQAIVSEVKPTGGFFDSVRIAADPLPQSGVDHLPSVTMTWEKFQKTILPDARSIEYHTYGPGNYVAFVTASDPAAPPLLAWDLPERRNPVSKYVRCHGSMPRTFGLPSNVFVKVIGISNDPVRWNEGPGSPKNFADGVYFFLEGAREQESDRVGLNLFPEILSPTMKKIEKVIARYSEKGQIENPEEGSACGIMFPGIGFTPTFRVTTTLGIMLYKLDRWD